MNASRGYYCVIQYCPDLSRLEAVNIGVLLFCPERDFLKARTSNDNARIRRFFGDEGHDWARINSFKLGIEERLEVEHREIRDLEALNSFIARRGNLIQITPPRPMKVRDPEKDLGRLFADLVGGQPRARRSPSLKKSLHEKFVAAGLQRKVETDIRIQVPISERQMEIPYGYRNGRFNLIQLAGFQSVDPERAKITACRYAVEGESLYENPNSQFGSMQLIIVGKFGHRQAESRRGVERILTAHHVRLFTDDELERLVEEIRTTAKELPENIDV